METTQRVIVVDGLSETEEVLRQVFEPRGLQVQRVRHTPQGTEQSRDTPPPGVLVLNAHDIPGPTTGMQDWDNVPRVVIGGRTTVPEENSARCRTLPSLFQYGELVSAIEGLLDRRAA